MGKSIGRNPWLEVFEENNAEEKVGNFHASLVSFLDQFLPEKRIKISQFDKKGFNPQLRALQRKKQRTFLKMGLWLVKLHVQSSWSSEISKTESTWCKGHANGVLSLTIRGPYLGHVRSIFVLALLNFTSRPANPLKFSRMSRFGLRDMTMEL